MNLGALAFSATLDSRIFGHGTLSGDFIPQPKSVEPPIEESEYWKYKSININNADNITVDGITIANAAFHTFNLVMIQSLPSNACLGHLPKTKGIISPLILLLSLHPDLSTPFSLRQRIYLVGLNWLNMDGDDRTQETLL